MQTAIATKMHPADISAAILKAGFTQTKIADQEMVRPSIVSEVIHGTATSHNIAYAIAVITGISTERMWPGKYLLPPAYQQARKGHKSGRLPAQKVAACG